MLDLLERDPTEAVVRLRRYLDYRSVASGEAVEAARADYRDVAKEREIRRTLPAAWRKLVEEGDELLCELVAEKVETLCGYRPELNLVAEFLVRSVVASGATAPQPGPRPTRATTASIVLPRTPPPPSVGSQSAGAMGFTFRGQWHPATSGRDALLQVFRLLAQRDPGFPERFAARTGGRGKRSYLARSPRELYPGTERLADVPSNARELTPGSGWWVDVHLSYRGIRRVVGIACDVAGLEYGTDLTLSLPG
jgi:hypothetical protein